MNTRFAKADEELVGYYTSAIGIHAQGYETGGAAFDPRRADDSLVETMTRGTRAWVDSIATTLAATPQAERKILELVYEPHGWPGFLAVALRPRWGGGSRGGTLVRLAIMSQRAINAHAKAYPGKESGPAQTLRFLVDEAGRGAESEPFFRRLVEECERPMLAALAAYDELRIARVKQCSQRLRAAEAIVQSRNEALLEDDRQKRRVRELASIEARLRGHAA